MRPSYIQHEDVIETRGCDHYYSHLRELKQLEVGGAFQFREEESILTMTGS